MGVDIINLCNLNCCDLKYLQTKFDAINKKISDNQKLQDRINKNIFQLLGATENGLKDYYALNESDYIKTLSSEDDINTLEPGTYKIVRTDMAQNAPTGIGIATYNGTLIKSQNYMALFEDTGFHFAARIDLSDNVIWTWYHYISKTQIDFLLFNYMKIRNYNKFNYSDVHDLTGFAAGVYYVDASVKNLPVATEGILIIRQGVNITDNYIVMFLPQNSNDIYKCCKKTTNTWSVWERLAFYSNIPSLDGYATKDWVNEQIQDITGGSVTEEWVKSNYYALTHSQYKKIPENTDYNTLTPGCYYGSASNFTNSSISTLGGTLLIIKFNTSNVIYRAIIYNLTNNRIYFCDSTATQVRQISYSEDIPNLSTYATKAWVNDNFWRLTTNNIPYTDINQLVTCGSYSVPSSVQNIPDSKAGFVYSICINSLNTVQLFIDTSYNIYTRRYVNNNFSDWKKFATINDIPSLSGYATQSWVQSQHYLTTIPEEYVTDTELTAKGYQTATQVNALITIALNGYATQAWVNSKGFLTEIPEEYVTASELQAQNYATQSWVTNKGYQTATQVNSAITNALKGYATQSWVNSQNFATEEWVGQQGYQTVAQVNSLINTATKDFLTTEDLDTLNYATENWVLQTALDGYATQSWVTGKDYQTGAQVNSAITSKLKGYATQDWVNNELNDYLPKNQELSLTTQGTYYGLQYQWARYGQVVEVFLVGNLTQTITNQLISDFCPANPMGTLQCVVPGYNTDHYAQFNNNGLTLMGTYNKELSINCHFTYLTNE